ncbi:Holliday junction branch migration protein RuvA [uncultured Clostridium sp.]|jgi:Holliday junction DNA helicase RuvA|uniref:Holliday junction branch migration protein RuvA n=1 Tax=uncultured Clostridium sp. TaxID=59620 RepID=UPI00260EFB7E|nr:Holliday junction branch migration protein RuvA [uncultured Clostridium sp.]
MYEYIKGEFKGLNKDYIILENGGIGYKVFTSGNTIANMPKVSDEVKLYIEQIVRQDFIGLYGFMTKEELSMFNLLLSINGVGAKAALSLLSISTVLNLKYAIIVGDEKHITRAPGIGKKTAQRIILELTDKLKKEDKTISADTEGMDISMLEAIAGNEARQEEAMEALMALGYTDKEAKKVLEKVDVTQTIENIIKESLRLLMS